MKMPFVIFSFSKKEVRWKKINFSYIKCMLKISRHSIGYEKIEEARRFSMWFRSQVVTCDKSNGDKEWIRAKSTRQSTEEKETNQPINTVPNRSRFPIYMKHLKSFKHMLDLYNMYLLSCWSETCTFAQHTVWNNNNNNTTTTSNSRNSSSSIITTIIIVQTNTLSIEQRPKRDSFFLEIEKECKRHTCVLVFKQEHIFQNLWQKLQKKDRVKKWE